MQAVQRHRSSRVLICPSSSAMRWAAGVGISAARCRVDLHPSRTRIPRLDPAWKEAATPARAPVEEAQEPLSLCQSSSVMKMRSAVVWSEPSNRHSRSGSGDVGSSGSGSGAEGPDSAGGSSSAISNQLGHQTEYQHECHSRQRSAQPPVGALETIEFVTNGLLILSDRIATVLYHLVPNVLLGL